MPHLPGFMHCLMQEKEEDQKLQQAKAKMTGLCPAYGLQAQALQQHAASFACCTRLDIQRTCA